MPMMTSTYTTNIFMIKPTMNVATLAISAPHVSAMISSVRARVLISIPLLTNIRRGRALSSSLGRSDVNVSLNHNIAQARKKKLIEFWLKGGYL